MEALLRITSIYLIAAIAYAPNLVGLEFQAGPTVGLFQQPTSQYYHVVYGGNISAENNSRTFGARYQFVERPRFESAGFADQESVHTLLLGGKVKDLWRRAEVSAFAGGGHVQGYLKPTSEQSKELYQRRGYLIRGLALELSLATHISKLRLAVSHQTIVGISSESELKSYVAWPYALYNLSIGCVL